MKKVILLFLVAMQNVYTFADSVEIDGVVYNIIEKAKYAEVESSHNTWSITIPDSIEYNGEMYPVESIGRTAFYFNGLSSISIPKTVNRIGGFAFEGCNNLSSVHISDLESWCNVEISGIDGCPLYYGHHLYINGTEITSIDIPNSITSIGKVIFAGSSITSINIPNSVTSIGDYAFCECKSLSNVQLPNSITKINNGLFRKSAISTIDIPLSVDSIGNSSFASCNNLTSIVIPQEVVFIDSYAFQGCANLKEIELPAKIKEIFDGAFSKCPNINDVYCKSESVPTTYGSPFSESLIEYATLHVPAGSIDEYMKYEPWKNFKNIVAIENNGQETQKCSTPIIKYENGKLDFSCATEGVSYISNITDSDIKTHYDSSITLNATYNISVYAIKAGHENSDVVTATLCWIDAEPKTEGITNGVASVRANPVLIQSCGNVFSISGVDAGTPISVYDMSGKQVGSANAASESTYINTSLTRGQIGIVKIGEKAVKIIVK